MTGIKGIISVAIMISLGIALLIALAAVKLLLVSLRFLSNRVLDRF